MKTTAWFALVMLAFVGSAAAQQTPHVCGSGPGPNEVQAGVQPGGSGMAPTPLCYWKQQRPGSSSPSTPLEDRWGAIASDGNGTFGIVANYTTKSDAEDVAIQDCKKRGGAGCKVELAYNNQCASVIAGATGSNISHGPTKEDSIRLGMKNCEAVDGAGSCRVYYSGCSLPSRIRQ